MTKRMLIDATHPEETRVAVVDGTRLEEFDFEIASRRQIKSNIYLAKVTRVEPSLQAAFVEYGGNRHGFLPFPEIHPDYYRIPVGDRAVHHDEPSERWSDIPSVASDDAYRESLPDEVPPEENHGSDESQTEPPAELAAASGEDDSDEVASDEDGREIPAAAASDPLISENLPDSEPLEASRANALVDEPEDAVSADPGTVAEVVEAVAVIDTVGGDEVEDAQRRRRTQMPHYKIQEVIKRRQIMLVQVSKEERGNKGAAVTTFLSLPGRYCVLMPNTARGGGVSRKIANPADRKRMKELISDLEVPEGMSVILRTAGVERSKTEIKRDLEYLLRLWENIRTLTLESTAPALIYEEGNLVKRAIRDLYSRDIESIEIAGEEGYRQAKDFMRMLMPSHAKRVQPYRDPSVPLFQRYQVESQIDLIHNPVAHLRSGGYIVINQTEALVSIDVNSGRSTRERNIEETALKTNCEAADEIARQLRLRDMGGLIVIDFIDMDEPRHDAQVERRLKEAMKNDRARIQVGRISPFGLLELSRQRMHPSLVETNFHTCPHCLGTGLVRSIESAALLVLRAIEEEGIKRRAAELAVTVAGNIALYILNQKRTMLIEIEGRYGFSVRIFADDSLIAPEHRIERVKMKPPGTELPPPMPHLPIATDEPDEDEMSGDQAEAPPEKLSGSAGEQGADSERKRKRRRSRRRRGRDDRPDDAGAGDGPRFEADIGTRGESDAVALEPAQDELGATADESEGVPRLEIGPPREGDAGTEGARRRRRGRRGGRSRPRRGEDGRLGALPPPPADDESEPMEIAGPQEIDFEDSTPDEPAMPHVPETAADEERAEALDLTAPTEPEPADLEPAAAEAVPAANGSAEPAPEPEPEPEPAVPAARAYEKINHPPDQPRRGWWKRLTE